MLTPEKTKGIEISAQFIHNEILYESCESLETDASYGIADYPAFAEHENGIMLYTSIKECCIFNPYTDWNHWRMLEEKIIEMDLLREYVDELVNNLMGDDFSKWSGKECLFEATLEQRMSAFLSVYQKES